MSASVYNVLCRCTILRHCGRDEVVLELLNFVLIIVLCRFGGLLSQCGIVGLLF